MNAINENLRPPAPTFGGQVAQWCDLCDQALKAAAEHEEKARAMRKIARSCLRKAAHLIERRLKALS